jgi:hypothetical protein
MQSLSQLSQTLHLDSADHISADAMLVADLLMSDQFALFAALALGGTSAMSR